jgi:sulfopyruvate decarboxylase subunit beta
MLGSIGLTSSIGLGLAKSTKRKVVVLDGDGSLLYNLGSLITVSMQKPGNLYWIVLDNESHGSTGFQRTYDASLTSLEKLALAAGFAKVLTANDKNGLKKAVEQLKEKGPLFVVVKIEKGNAKVDPIPLSPALIKSRFMEEVKKG